MHRLAASCSFCCTIETKFENCIFILYVVSYKIKVRDGFQKIGSIWVYRYKIGFIFLVSIQFFYSGAAESSDSELYNEIITSYGYENNPLTLDTERPINQGDHYLELSGSTYIPLSKKIHLSGELYKRDYRSLDSIDFNEYSIGLDYKEKFGGWKITPSISVAVSEYGGDDYQTVSKYSLQFDKNLSKHNKFRFFYQYSDINSDNVVYDNLAGTQDRYRLDYKLKSVLGKIRIRYQLDYNDGQSFKNAEAYSLTNNTLSARISRSIANWKMVGKVEYRHSEYAPNRKKYTPRESKDFFREDERLKLSIDFSREFTEKWTLGMFYAYIDNDSNLAVQSYDTNDFQVYVVWSF